jgi:hypothetical protein
MDVQPLGTRMQSQPRQRLLDPRGGVKPTFARERRPTMSRFIATALAVALAVVTLSTGLWSGESPPLAVGESRELAPGWVLKNLGEYPANVPGYDKVRIVELTGQPGATIGPDEMLGPHVLRRAQRRGHARAGRRETADHSRR